MANRNNSTLGLMAKRLGVFYQQPPVMGKDVEIVDTTLPQDSIMARRLGIMHGNQSVNPGVYNPSIPDSEHGPVLDIDGVNNQAALLEYNGGHLQQERMVYDKRRSLDRAVLYSYQGADIKHSDEDEKPCRGLINPNKLKQDYDDKVLSVGFEYGFKSGDVFDWIGTNTKWLIYLQDLTELAYFRGEVRKCSYKINWQNDDGDICSSYAATRGPVETKINFLQKNGTSVDKPNYSLDILMPKTEESLKYFRRYKKFYVQSIIEPDLLGLDKDIAPTVCWRVEAVDWISMPGIIEVIAVEYYVNSDTDDLEEGIADKILAQNFEEDNTTDETGYAIDGDTFIKPKLTKTYTFSEDNGLGWSFDKKKYPIEVISQSNTEIQIKWNGYYSGQFELNHNITKNVAVDIKNNQSEITIEDVKYSIKTVYGKKYLCDNKNNEYEVIGDRVILPSVITKTIVVESLF